MCAAGPTISQKIDQSGSSVQSHSLRQFGSFHSSMCSNRSSNRSRTWTTKSLYAGAQIGGEAVLGTMPIDGGVYSRHGSTSKSRVSRGRSHPYQAGASSVYQSAHEI